MTSGIRRSIAGWMLLAILFLSTAVVFHTDLDGRYHPNCPACQLEHNPGLHTSAVSSATIVVMPVALFFILAVSKVRLKQFFRTLEIIPRSPPESSKLIRQLAAQPYACQFLCR